MRSKSDADGRDEVVVSGSGVYLHNSPYARFLGTEDAVGDVARGNKEWTDLTCNFPQLQSD